MNYTEAIAYLYSLADYEKTRIERYTSETLDLLRVERLLAAVGDPHTRFRAVHIAGTKGKGSTAAMSESCLRAAGYRTGFYTSPHMHTFRERIQVNGHKIARDQIAALVEEVRPAIKDTPGVTYLEAITAIGFLHFGRSEVDVAVVEVGLGGRLDATNVLTPEVAIITSLSFDHTYLLGNTLGARRSKPRHSTCSKRSAGNGKRLSPRWAAIGTMPPARQTWTDRFSPSGAPPAVSRNWAENIGFPC
jgi:dihydrofolate synthase/folylpolyglutamate synthase